MGPELDGCGLRAGKHKAVIYHKAGVLLRLLIWNINYCCNAAVRSSRVYEIS